MTLFVPANRRLSGMTEGEPSDAELVARCLVAQEAFELLYRRHAPVVFAFLKSMHRFDQDAAADSLQETFLRAFNALGTFDRTRPLRPWLLTIAHNVMRDAHERARIQPRPDLPDRPGPVDATEAGVIAEDACETIL